MRPYLAIIKDSFRHALGSAVLWIIVALLTLILAALAPLSYMLVATTKFQQGDVQDWDALMKRVSDDGGKLTSSPGKRIWSLLSTEVQKQTKDHKPPAGGGFNERSNYVTARQEFMNELNRVIAERDFYSESAWRGIDLGYEGQQFLREKLDELPEEELQRFNRLLVERAFPELIEPSTGTSMVITWFWIRASPPLPFRQQELHRVIRGVVSTICDWLIGVLGVLVALLVTAPIIPRIFDSGQLHLLLSKPVSRSVLLIAQYFGGCAYVLVLVSYLCLGLWLLLGLRFGYWEASLLWMIPLQVFVFAIYYAVSVSAGIVFRNSIVSIVVCMVLWVVCWGLGVSNAVLENLVVGNQRITRIINADQTTLVVDQSSIVRKWNEDTRKWDEVFVSQQQRELGAFAFALQPMVGPVYDPERKSIIAVQRMFGPGMGANLAVGKEEKDWKQEEGVSPPMGTFALFRDPQGAIIAVGNLGVFRLAGDPLKKPQPVKILGYSLPFSPAGPFQDLSPAGGLILASPASVDMDVQTGDLVAYSRGKLMRLVRQPDGKYTAGKERTIDVESQESLAIAMGGKRVVLARRDGRLQVLNAETLEDVSTTSPEDKNAPRFITASPDGQRFAVVFHVGTLWTYDIAADEWSKPRVAGQGNISAVGWTPEQDMLVADDATRVTTYDGETGRQTARLAPLWEWYTRVYRYGIQPLYTILPKPGEIESTFEYLASGEVTQSLGEGGSDEDVSVARVKLRPWAPIWSGALFIGVVLLLTCVYFERQEY